MCVRLFVREWLWSEGANVVMAGGGGGGGGVEGEHSDIYLCVCVWRGCG